MITITFGSISLVFNGEFWMLEQTSGEAMEISEKEIEKILQNYYGVNF